MRSCHLTFVVITLHMYPCLHLVQSEDICPSSANSTSSVNSSLHDVAFDLRLFGIARTLLNPAANLILSPIAIKFAIGVLISATKRDTRDELRGAILEGRNSPADELVLHLAKGVSHLNLSIANAFYLDRSMSGKGLDNNVLSCLHADICVEDFENGLTHAKRAVNKFVSQSTGGKIVEMVGSGSLTVATNVILVNALYIPQHWFRKLTQPLQSSKRQTFHVSNQHAVSVTTITKIDQFAWLNEQDATHVGVPGLTDDMVMILSLPAAHSNITHFEGSLTPQYLLDIKAALTATTNNHQVEIIIPQFVITRHLILNRILEKFGVKSIFAEGADLSGLLVENVFINKIYHQTYFELQGTAVQDNIPGPTAANKFRADRPFMVTVWKGDILMLVAVIIDPSTQQTDAIPTTTSPTYIVSPRKPEWGGDRVCSTSTATPCILLAVSWIITAAFVIFCLFVCFNHAQTLKQMRQTREEKEEWQQKLEELQLASERRIINLLENNSETNFLNEPTALAAEKDHSKTDPPSFSAQLPAIKGDQPAYKRAPGDTDDDPYYVMY